jgi:hypothetical protein
LGALTAFIAACGGGGGGGGDKNYGEPLSAGTAQKQAASTSVTDVAKLPEAVTGDAGNESALAGTTQTYANLNSLTAFKQQQELQNGAAGAPAGGLGSAVGLLRQLDGALDASCYSSDGQTTTYTQCSFGGGYTIDGTLSFAGETLSVDLTLVSAQPGGVVSGFEFAQQGTLTINATGISGELTYDAQVSASGGVGGAFSAETDVTAIYAVVLEAGCPVGGSLEVNAVTTANVAGLPPGASAGNQSTWVRADFGPNCGDVTLY